ncbi:Dbl domain-containing protein [Salix suchowensis]|nr:Dbl domain-containing protein [Salix suchowensis]
MKAFLSRLHIGGGAKDKERDPQPVQKEKFPPLRSWPPDDHNRATSTPTSYASFKPLPELLPSQLADQFSPRLLPPIDEPASTSTRTTPTPTPTPTLPYTPSPQPTLRNDDPSAEAANRVASPSKQDPEAPGRISRKPTSTSVNTSPAPNEGQKKQVAFISPPPTPNLTDVDRSLPDAPANSQASASPLKTTLTRFQAMHGKEPRGSTSTSGASSSKTDLSAAPSSNTAVKATSTRATSPSLHKTSGDGVSMQSLRSGTPYSQMSQSSGSRILAATSWSEVIEDDLVSNIGSRERTRQEVLFEIISSEERYVQELIKMKETFIDPLLHPFSSASTPLSASTPNLDYDYYRAESPLESTDHLPPIAARFMSPTPTTGHAPGSGPSSIRNKDTPNIDGESLDTDEEAEVMTASERAIPLVYQMARSMTTLDRRIALRRPRRVPGRAARQYLFPPAPTNPSRLLPARIQWLLQLNLLVGNRLHKSVNERETIVKAVLEAHDLPEAWHAQEVQEEPEFSRGRIRWLHCSPTATRRSALIDNGVLEGHKRLSEALKKRYDDQFPLVRSLADVFVANCFVQRAWEEAKKQDMGEWQRVCKALQKVEESAADKGETGLAITISKPFQRLLKYPLLFQNLLFHTDPSTYEYESTLQMVAEVETIVRSIEDEKIQKEERDKTRDVFARIEGLEKVKQLAMPKPSRVLIEERQCFPPPPQPGQVGKLSSPPPSSAKNVRGKSSFKRLSDVLSNNSNGIGGKKDLWLVVFNDVVLQCQRTGTTSVPLVSGSSSSRTTSMPELQGNKTKYATTGRRNAQLKARNLYKFLKQDELLVLGADKVTVQKPVIKSRPGVGVGRRGASNSPSYGRESSANAKFGTRLISDSSPTVRAASRRAAGTPTSKKPVAVDDNINYAKATVTRPAWDGSTRSALSPTPGAKRTRNTSQTSSTPKLAVTNKPLASPAPSEDSGVGLYRQMIANDGLNQI